MLDLLKRTFNSSLLRPTSLNEGEFQLYLPLHNKTITYQLKLSQRKSLSIEIKHSHLLVKAPYWADLTLIETFLLKKQSWIVNKQQQHADYPSHHLTYQTGDKLLLFGQWITLVVNEGAKFKLCLHESDQQLILTKPKQVKNHQQYVRNKLMLFYTDQAEQYIRGEFNKLEKTMQLQAKALEFKVYKRRWGCCYASGLIKINPMIMGAPSWVIECVLIHELSHLKHMDHSAKFWRVNQQYCGNCQTSKQWLAAHSQALTLN